MAYEWHDISTIPKFDNDVLPYSDFCDFVYFSGVIHILGGSVEKGTSRYHYSSSDKGKTWTREADLPYDFEQGNATLYDGEIHILGGFTATSASKHYYLHEGSWQYRSTLPYAFTNGCVLVIGANLHIIGSSFSGNEKKHYSWNGTSWTSRSTLPVNWSDRTQAVHLEKFNSGTWEDRILLVGGSVNLTGLYCSSLESTTSMTWTAFNNLSFPFKGRNIFVSNDTSFSYYTYYGQSMGYVNLRIDVSININSGSLNSTPRSITNSPNTAEFSYYSDFLVGGNAVYLACVIALPNDKKLYGLSRTGSTTASPTFSTLYTSDIFDFNYGSAVVYDDKIHILCGNKMYYYDNGSWIESSEALPYYFYSGSAVVYNGRIHILGGGSGNETKHYSWDGTEWSEESTLPYEFYNGSGVVYDGKIHILGSNDSDHYTEHYSWDGTEWSEESTLPYNFNYGSAVVYDGSLHILGGGATGSTNHYSWDGTEWSEESTLPYEFSYGVAIVQNNKINILGGYATANKTSHYSWDGTAWTEEGTLPYYFSQGCAVIYEEKLVLLGGYEYNQKHYSGYHNNHLNHVKFGENHHVLDMRDDTATAAKIPNGVTAHGKTGLIEGTRPKYFKHASSKYMRLLRNPIFLDTTASKLLFYLNGNVPIYMRLSGTNIQLYTTKTDGVTETSINIGSISSAVYQPTFAIYKIHYVMANMVMIYMRWDSSATQRATTTWRWITMKYDNTLFQGTAYNVDGSTTSTTTDRETIFIRYLFTNGNDFFRLYKAKNITTGNVGFAGYYYYCNLSAGTVATTSSATINISENANSYVTPFDACCIKGGIFYKNTSATDYIAIFGSYNISSKVLTLANAGGGMAEIGALSHYVLGLSMAGYFITVKADSDAKIANKTLYAWVFDITSTTNVFVMVGTSGVSIGNQQLVAFQHDILVFADGSRKQLFVSASGPVVYDLEPLEIVSEESINFLSSKNFIGPESDPWGGVFIYGD